MLPDPSLSMVYGAPNDATADGRVRRARRQFRLGLFGVFGCGNFGNDATLDACLAGIGRAVPPSQMMCVASNPEVVAGQHKIHTFPITVPPSLAYARGPRLVRPLKRVLGEGINLVRAWCLLRRVGTFVIAGTGVLDDQHVSPLSLPLDVFRWSLAARLARARLVFFAVGAGPISHPASKALLTQAVRLAHEVSYRDERSRAYMRGLGRDVSQDRVLPDLALAFRPPRRVPALGRKSIAIGLLSRLNWQGRPQAYLRYEDALVSLITRLVDRDWQIELVGGDEVDADTERSLVERPELMGCPIKARKVASFAAVVDVASVCEAMVGSRYHNIVAAIIAGIPVVSLGYGPKNLALLEQLGVPEWSHDIDEFDVEAIVRQVEAAARLQRPLYQAQLIEYREVLARQYTSLVNG